MVCEAVLVWRVEEVLAAQKQLLVVCGRVFLGAWRFLQRAKELIAAASRSFGSVVL